MYVPAKLTWLLQPADTHVLAGFKRQLRARWLPLRVASDSGAVALNVWLLEVFQVAQKVYCSNTWKPAFEGDGLLDESKLSDRVLKHLEWVAPKPVACTMLTAEQVECVFPRRSRIQFDALFCWALPNPRLSPSQNLRLAPVRLPHLPVTWPSMMPLFLAALGRRKAPPLDEHDSPHSSQAFLTLATSLYISTGTLALLLVTGSLSIALLNLPLSRSFLSASLMFVSGGVAHLQP